MSWFRTKELKEEVEMRGDGGIRDEGRGRIRKRTR